MNAHERSETMRLEDLKINFLHMDEEAKRLFIVAIRRDRLVKKASKAQKVAKKRTKLAASDMMAELSSDELATLLQEFE